MGKCRKRAKNTEKDGQGYHEAEMGIKKAIEQEPADSGDTSFLMLASTHVCCGWTDEISW